MKRPSPPSLYLLLVVVPVVLSSIAMGYIMTTESDETPLRSRSYPLFNPHMPTFDCEIEAGKLPAIDAQAEAWFLEGRSLENPEVYFDDQDHKKIVQLTRYAAERNHWKAMLNLASYYLHKWDPEKGQADAVALVERAMRLGVPAAYDRMGTYYKNSTGVQGDTTRAYALWQKAAMMGNPQAMAYLGDKLDAASDSEDGDYWANTPIALKMLTCAIGQGHGNAAYSLALSLTIPPEGHTNEDRQLALRVLHHAVRLGCENCANKLSIEFGRPFSLANMVAPFIDQARSARYAVLGKELFFDSTTHFPNLDKVVPLPPASLPPWNGDRDTLLLAAKGVTSVESLTAMTPDAAPYAASRFFVPPEFILRKTDTTTKSQRAPTAGYWRPLTADKLPLTDAQRKPIQPGLYKRDEPFSQFAIPSSNPAKFMEDIVWEYWITAWSTGDAVAPRAPKHLIRVVPRPTPFVSLRADEICPKTGTWQPWLPANHPMAGAVNQYWRQGWVVAGQPFPQPKTDWWLDIPSTDITWHLMDDAPVDINTSVKK